MAGEHRPGTGDALMMDVPTGLTRTIPDPGGG